jgi:hypothetical protein
MTGRTEDPEPPGEDAERKALPAQATAPQPAPPPSAQQAPAAGARRKLLERLVALVGARPLLSLAGIFLALTALHVAIMNAAGVLTGVFIGKTIFLLDAAARADLLLLALIAACIVLPSLMAASSQRALAETTSAHATTATEQAAAMRTLAAPNIILRLVFGVFWAAVLTPVFGGLMQPAVASAPEGTFLITLWLYLRLALVFGMMGSCLAYVSLLQYRLSAAFAAQLRVDLFDPSALAPLARHMRLSILYLSLPLLLLGPILSRPEAATASAILMGFGIVIILLAGFGGAWGARSAICKAKQKIRDELNAYSREIWRRAYSNGRIVEAVALPAMAGMLTIRNQIGRMANWPGGWPNVLKCLILALAPAVTWFGPQAIQSLIQPFL